MARILSLVLLAAACLAQDKPVENAKPPQEVDKALRERVNQFFQDHVTAHFRQAEELVAEDSKDFFYDQNKPHYLAYHGIQNIRYSENFTHAYVTVTVETAAAAEGGGYGMLPSIPIPSMWKLEKGLWCWYIDPAVLRRTPFGDIPAATMAAAMAAMHAPAADPNVAPTPVPPEMASALKTAIPSIPAAMSHDPNAPTGQIKLEHSSVEMKPGGTASVNIHNGGSNALELILVGQVKGVDAALDQRTLAGGNSTSLLLRAGKDARSGTINVVVVQTGEMIPLEIAVK